LRTNAKKALTCLLISLSLLLIFGLSKALDYYTCTSSCSWDFHNNCYLGFEQDTKLTGVPKRGGLYDAAVVGYWSMNEGDGMIANDESGNGNDGLATQTTIVDGKYGKARYFDGNSTILVNDSKSLRFGEGDFSLSATIELETSGNGTLRTIIRKGNTGYNPFYCIRINTANKVDFTMRDSPEPAHSYTLTSTSAIPSGEWQTITATFNNATKLCALYINGILNTQLVASGLGDISSNKMLAIGRASETLDQYFVGSIDEVRIYNRTLSSNDVAELFSLPDPLSLTEYFCFADYVTGNVMIVNVENSSNDASNVVYVNCSNFFATNKLTFQANDSAFVNVWTNLGEPVFTTGIWNNENHTTTLTLEAFSTEELYWNIGSLASVSSFSTTATDAGANATFSVLWNDNHSLSGGGYVFSTNNTGRWANASWTPFTSTPCWGNVSLTLNSTVGLIVGFREFANNSLGLWFDSGIYSIKTTNGTSKTTPSPTPNSTTTANPTLTPTETFNPTQNPTPGPAQAILFPSETIFMVMSILAGLTALFVLAFKKGFITVEVVSEEGSSQAENSEDYNI
jgi:hypothetical protein